MPNGIVVEGHTDNVPIKSGRCQTNRELSMERAYSVLAFMEGPGMERKKLAGIGYSENRRIEISRLKTE